MAIPPPISRASTTIPSSSTPPAARSVRLHPTHRRRSSRMSRAPTLALLAALLSCTAVSSQAGAGAPDGGEPRRLGAPAPLAPQRHPIRDVLLAQEGDPARPQRHPIRDALFLGNATLSENGTADDCVWRRERDPCPDPDVTLHLYTEAEPHKRVVDLFSEDWLRQSGWEPAHETVLVVHGYAGGDDTLPITVLRDAYLRRGGYNVFMLDWGALCRPPCYVAAVHNLRQVARCAAESLTALRRAGLRPDRLTCVGHSLGAHICGIMSNYLTFRLNRIIGLDPARPLIRAAPAARLDAGDARAVHVLHTNAGRYGDAARLGHADFCLNGGRSQPYCEDTPNEALCSHIWSICYQAESLFRTRLAEPCGRRCSVRVPPARAQAQPVPLGHAAPASASGAYCIEDTNPPFCPATSGLADGDPRCCLDAQYAAAAAAPPRAPRPRPLVRLRERRRHAALPYY